MRRCAGFNTDQARRQLLEKRQDVAPLQLTADDHMAFRVDAMDLKNRLGDVETDCRDRLHAWLLRIMGGLNSTHIHGTPVPVEEPSTASILQKGCAWQYGLEALPNKGAQVTAQ